MRRALAVLTSVLAVLVTSAPPLRAATEASIFEVIPYTFSFAAVNPSTRSAGMGGAGGAVFWGDAPNAWANPALLGLASGVRYDHESAAYPAGLDFEAGRTTLGLGGVGLSLEGQPFDAFGERKLGMDWEGSSAYGSTWTFSFSDRVRSWGAGVSVAGLLQSWAHLRQREAPAIARHFDLALGYAENVLEADFRDSGSGVHLLDRGVSHDLGLLVRAGTALPVGGLLPQRIDAAYGFSGLGQGGGHVGSARIQRQRRHAVASRAVWGAPRGWADAVPAWSAAALEPFLSLGVAYDLKQVTSAGPGFHTDSDHVGTELGLTRLVALQLGRSHTASDWVTTWGFALTLPVGRYGGARYAQATVPSAPSGLFEDTTHRSWSVWLDPVAIAGAVR